MSKVETDIVIEQLRGDLYAARAERDRLREESEAREDRLAVVESQRDEARAIVDLAYAMFLAADLPKLADKLDERRVWLKSST